MRHCPGRSIRIGSSPLWHLVPVDLYPGSDFHGGFCPDTTSAGRATTRMRHGMLLQTTAHASMPCWPLCDFPIGQMLWRVTGAERQRTSRVRLRASLRNCSSGKPINNSQDLLRPRHQGLRVDVAALQSSLKQSGQAILSLGRSIRGGSSPLRHLVAVGLYPRSEFLDTTSAGRPTSHMHRGRLLRAAADVNKP